ncbi:MAG TPA: hypothetical protein VM344_00875 [Vitreimonas sp.]|nr:hypothetical protein [Vitreimonas sp.]
MNRIYLEPGVMALPTGSELPPDGAAPTPGAVEALGHLADSYELVVIGDPPRRLLDAFQVPVRGTSCVPPEPAHGSWLITDDPTSCVNRAPGLKTLLVGPRRAVSHKPAPRCDAEARDLGAAVVEILTREAMS